MTDKTTRVAYHEAAHAVAQLRFSMTCDEVSIVPDEDSLGHANPLDGFDDAENAGKYILSLLAGHVACIHLDPSSVQSSRAGSSYDFEEAERILGVLEDVVDETCWDRWLEKTREWVTDEANWRAIEEVAAELLEYQSLDDFELEMIVAGVDGDQDALLSLIRYRMDTTNPPRIVLPEVPGSTIDGRYFTLTRGDNGEVLARFK